MAIASAAILPTWRSLDDAAAQTDISRRTLTRWISEGRLRAYARGGDRKRYVDLDEVRQAKELQPVESAETRRQRLLATFGTTPPDEMSLEQRDRMLTAGFFWDGQGWVRNLPAMTTRVPPPHRPARRR